MTDAIRYHSFLAAALFAAATLHAAPAGAEDIDLFRYSPANSAPPPNVLFMVDNSANWEQDIAGTEKRVMIHNALESVFSDTSVTPDDSMSVGVMTFAHGNDPKGGKVVEHVRLLDDDSAFLGYSSYRSYLLDIFRRNTGPRDPDGSGLQKGNNAPYALAFHETYLYYGGRAVRAGLQDDGIAHDPDAVNSGNYVSPSTDVCRNFAILVASGDPDSGEDRQAEDELDALGGILEDDPLNLDPSNFESNWADEYARFLNSIDIVPEAIAEGEQNLTTYVIDVFDDSVNHNRPFNAARAYLKSIAQQGGGSYFEAHDKNDIRAAIEDALAEIKAVNSVFAATALPVSVNVRGTNLNQVYIGVFRPDENDRPRWFGNLKLYQLDADPDTGEVFLADVNGDPAQSSTTGFIRPEATSFWTHDSTFWSFSPRGDTDTPESDAPDGDMVEKGGVAQRVRELGDTDDPPDGEVNPAGDDYSPLRTVYTCTGSCLDNPGSALSATPFDTGNGDITASDLNVSTETEADLLIRYIRGEDNAINIVDGVEVEVDEDNDTLTNDVRASVHGDVLHSQPSIVNYGTGGEEDVIVFYGANDGMIHAVRGGKDQSVGGEELWGFVPPEFFGKLKDLRENPDSAGKTYFADGGLASHVIDNDGDGIVEPTDGDKVYLFAGMRRGGRFLYGLDVTDKTNPKFLWRVDNTMAGFAELGQSWSDPQVSELAGFDDPVVFFGAGYDPAAEDPDPDTGADDSANATEGRGLFAVNGRTGELLWQAGVSPDTSGSGETLTVSDMSFSMPASPTVIDRDFDGFADRVYIPDTGGQVWRANLVDDQNTDGPDFSLWNVYKLASVGSDQEFHYAVDVVDGNTSDGELAGQYDAVLLGAGDRENPFNTSTVNRFYMFKDSQTEAAPSGVPFTLSDLFDATDNVIQDGTDSESTTAINTLEESDGWYITLENAGEKVVGSATTLAGTTFFNTNQPPSDTVACTANLGIARNYAVDFQDATANLEQDGQAGLTKADRSGTTPGGGFPPSPVPIVVSIDGKQYLSVISGTTVTSVPNIPLGVRERVFWHREDLD